MELNVPTLRTERLVLRPFREDDGSPMYDLLSEPDVLRYFPPGPPLAPERVVRMIQRLQGHWEEHGFGLWAVETRADGQLIGRCGLQTIPETGETEVDYILGTPHWGQGYATEAAARSVAYGFERLAVAEIVGIVHPDNVASRRVLEKIGMQRIERTVYFGMEVVRYTIQRVDWRPRDPKAATALGAGA